MLNNQKNSKKEESKICHCLFEDQHHVCTFEALEMLTLCEIERAQIIVLTGLIREKTGEQRKEIMLKASKKFYAENKHLPSIYIIPEEFQKCAHSRTCYICKIAKGTGCSLWALREALEYYYESLSTNIKKGRR